MKIALEMPSDSVLPSAVAAASGLRTLLYKIESTTHRDRQLFSEFGLRYLNVFLMVTFQNRHYPPFIKAFLIGAAQFRLLMG
jgi:hypothetical protein